MSVIKDSLVHVDISLFIEGPSPDPQEADGIIDIMVILTRPC